MTYRQGRAILLPLGIAIAAVLVWKGGWAIGGVAALVCLAYALLS